MASFPGFELEDFIEDLYTGYDKLNNDQKKRLLALWEPQRESVEISLDQFEEDEHSWRDYRNNLASMYDLKDEDEKIFKEKL